MPRRSSAELLLRAGVGALAIPWRRWRRQAFHFKGGQGAKTGTGGQTRSPPSRGARVAPRRDLSVSVSDWTASPRTAISRPRCEVTGGIPIGFALCTARGEGHRRRARDRCRLHHPRRTGGGTGAAPTLFAITSRCPPCRRWRARRHLDACGASDVTLVITEGLRVPADFIKALALGANAHRRLQLGHAGHRLPRCAPATPTIARSASPHRSQAPRAARRRSAARLERFFRASVELMQVMARACGYAHLSQFSADDLTTFDRDWRRSRHRVRGVG